MDISPLGELGTVFIPTVFLLAIMFRWQLKSWVKFYANIRMLLQLLMVGYFFTCFFDNSEPIVIIVLLAVMIGVSRWIALRSFEGLEKKPYFIVLTSIATAGLILLVVVTQLVLEMPR
jgi:putative ABC transport system permease protein